MDLRNLNPNQQWKKLRSKAIATVRPSKSLRIGTPESDDDGKAKPRKII